jgi:hypothetical protein
MIAVKRLFPLFAVLTAGMAWAQPTPHDRTPGPRPVLLVVGSGHLANPGRDTVNIQIEDITTPARQREIEAWSINWRPFIPPM